MNTEKIEKLKKSLSNSKIPADLKPKIEAEIKRLESLDDIATEKAKEEKEEEKEEAKPVAKTRKPRAKRTSTRKPSETSKPKRTAMSLAKEIRKEGESWKDAQARASKMMKEGSKEITKTVETELDKLTKLVKSKKELRSQVGRTNLLIDAKRKAKPMGRRISKDGNVYYENRANRTDRGTYGKYHLATGGYLTDPTFGTFQNQVFAGGGGVTSNTKVILTENKPNGAKWQGVVKPFMLKSIEENQYAGGFKRYEIDIYDEVKTEPTKEEIKKANEFFDKIGGRYATGGSVTNERRYVNKGEDYEVRYSKPILRRKGYQGKRDFELGGTVVTDLAGHTGGGDAGLNAGMPLNGFSNTGYTGLVGETGAMSSGEMFMAGGTLPSGAEQSYMITESFGNPAQHYARGGGIPNNYEGKTPEEVWKSLSYTQKEHFLSDHLTPNNFDYFQKKGLNKKELARVSWENLEFGVRKEFYEHVNMGQYARGGGVRRVGNREYSYGRNWTNDHRHINKSEDHEVRYTRKGKFLGVFDDGGFMSGGEGYAGQSVLLTNTKTPIRQRFIGKELVLQDKQPNGSWSATVRKTGEKVPFDVYAEDFEQYAYGGMTNLTIQDVSFATGGEVKLSDLKVESGMGAGKKTWEVSYPKIQGKGVYFQDQYTKEEAKEHWLENVASKYKFANGGALTNERKHVNKDEDYEVRYAKPRPKRKGYKGARKFMAGGSMETPRIYVADLEAYNNGRLIGEWLDLSDYNDADELMDAIQDVLKKSGGEEYAIHDYENFPSVLYSEYMSRNDFQALYDVMETAKRFNLPLAVVQDIVSQYGEGGVEEFYGKFDNAEDFAYQQVEELGLENFSSPEYYIDITETDRRLLAQDMANGYVEDINYEGGGNRLIEEASMDVEEYEEADNQTQQEMIDKATEIVYDEYYDTWYEGLDDPYYFLVEEQGLYSKEDFFKASFIIVNYEKLARDLEQDYTFIEYDGDLYVFNIR